MTVEKSRRSEATGTENTGHLDGRLAPTQNSASSPVSSKFRILLDANGGAHSGTTHKQPTPRLTRQPIRDLSAIAKQMSERDWAILRSVAEHRFLTVRHIQTLHFGDLTPGSGRRKAQRALAKLRRLRVLDSLTQRVGGLSAGSDGKVHYVDDVGQRLLRRESGAIARRRFHAPTERFLDHQLSIADAHVALVEADRQGQLELLKCEIEPAAWRDYVGMGGTRLTLKPDLYAETACPPGSEYVDAAFIEIDKGTESIPTLIRKCHEYEAYWRLGIEQERNGGFPLVVWSITAETPSKADKRRDALRRAIDKNRKLRPELFRIIAPIQLIATLQKGAEV
ncbi:replication-relaxation family protein [Nocardia farcinica]|uniref:replication-relaxation family protein n=1 Tax=Nocardia farcinica TaxID=37329 RepID=UPI002456C7BD|nr:replication-relaxation family protein [Nocardia farcinica]